MAFPRNLHTVPTFSWNSGCPLCQTKLWFCCSDPPPPEQQPPGLGVGVGWRGAPANTLSRAGAGDLRPQRPGAQWTKRKCKGLTNTWEVGSPRPSNQRNTLWLPTEFSMFKMLVPTALECPATHFLESNLVWIYYILFFKCISYVTLAYYFESFLLSDLLTPHLGNHNKKGSKTKISIWIMIYVAESSSRCDL